MRAALPFIEDEVEEESTDVSQNSFVVEDTDPMDISDEVVKEEEEDIIRVKTESCTHLHICTSTTQWQEYRHGRRSRRRS